MLGGAISSKGEIINIEYEIISENKFKERNMNFNEAIFFEEVILRDKNNRDVSVQILSKTFDEIQKSISIFYINNASLIEMQTILEQNFNILKIDTPILNDYLNLSNERKTIVVNTVFIQKPINGFLTPIEIKNIFDVVVTNQKIEMQKEEVQIKANQITAIENPKINQTTLILPIIEGYDVIIKSSDKKNS